MDIALKQRLVGATILIALAVIFLPLLLDGENHDGQSTQPIEIPERPDVNFKTRRLPVGDHSQTDQEPEGRPLPQADTNPAPAETVEISRGNDSGNEGAADPLQLQDQVVNKPVETPSQPVVQQAAPAEITANGDWLVQVGTFGSLENANRLGSELDSLGYAAMLEATGSSSDSLVRVKIGPFNSATAAEKAVERIAAAIPGVKPRVVGITSGNSQDAAVTSGWVVQLGSFSSTENAAKLSSRLREKGITVFTDSLDAANVTVYRVRTGAVAGRAAAEQLRDTIRQKSDITGIVKNMAEQ